MLSKKQTEFLTQPLSLINILSGCTGSGKTFASNLKWYQLILQASAGSKFLLSGNTSESLYDNVIEPLLQIDATDKNLQWVSVANKRRLIVNETGTQVICIGANNEQAQSRIQGKNIAGWYCDEVTKVPASFIDMAASRCRQLVGDRMIVTPIIWTCNPDGPSHVVKRDYIDAKDKGVTNWFFGFEDNPHITPEYIEAQRSRFSGVFYDRMFEGKWVAAEGAIYNFNRNIHVVKEYPINLVKEYLLGVDWGYSKDHALAISLIAVTDDAYYVIDEIYSESQLIDESLKMLIEDKGWFKLPQTHNTGIAIETFEVKPSMAYADSARPDNMEQFRLITNITTSGGVKTSVNEGIQSVQRLLVKPLNGNPRLFVTENCINTIREFELYRWDSFKSGEGKDKPVQKDDHIMDAIRYVVHTRDSGQGHIASADFRQNAPQRERGVY
jgi:PBSX family phage terminase large subunit